MTPYIAVQVEQDVVLPNHVKTAKDILLKVSDEAVTNLRFLVDRIEFDLVDDSDPQKCSVPISRILVCGSIDDAQLEVAAASFHRGNYVDAIETFAEFWNAWSDSSAYGPKLQANRAILLMHWANALDSLERYAEAFEKYTASFQILYGELLDRPELQAERARLQMHWAIALAGQRQYQEAENVHALAWQILGVELIDQPELQVDRAKLLMHWANALSSNGKYADAVDKFTAAWQILNRDLSHHPDLQVNRARLEFAWPSRWRGSATTPKPQTDILQRGKFSA
jgi:tetratricopeptide (TPR) repeat protein